MNRALIAFVLTLAMLVAACGRTPSAASPSASALPPLSGAYRALTGEVDEFHPDGTFLSLGVRGAFTVDGTSVVIRVGDQSIPATRTSADTVAFHRPGRPDAVFYRVGSAAAQTAAAHSATPTATTKPAPDRATPLDRYTAITDPETLRVIALAFSAAPVSDDQKLSLLPAGKTTSDAFARRALLAQELPGLNARIEGQRGQRYYRIAPSTVLPDRPGYRQTPQILEWRVISERPPGVSLTGAYDFTQKGFPINCLQASRVTNMTQIDTGSNTAWPGTAVAFQGAAGSLCLLPVPDEAVAKTIEAFRATRPPHDAFLNANATLYFFVVDADGDRIINSVLTHVDLSLLDPADHTNATVLARLAFDP